MGTGDPKKFLVVILIGLMIGSVGVPPGYAQAPVAGGGAPASKLSAAQLEDLVGRVALYPDDLLAILLPASTYPLEIVQAERFLQKLKKDPKLQPDARWQQSVRSLLNYPEVITMMSQDLDWTEDLGEAVVTQQGDVVSAIQSFRQRVQTMGNLKSNDKQIIVQEKEVIKIVPANPEVIYVPQYQPSTVVIYQSAPVVVYYPTSYPVYYYPYPAGAAFATGFFFGAVTASAFNWGRQEINVNVNINNTDNLNINRTNTQYRQSAQEAKQRGQQRAQQPATRQSQQRPGGQPATQQASLGQGGGTKWQSAKRPGEVSGRPASAQPEARPGYGAPSQSRGDAFANYGSGQDAMQSANRGEQSRSGGEFSGASRGGGGPQASSMQTRGGGSGRGGSSGGGASRGGGGGRRR